ncbi:TetR-like C-terminal domain-containing protein [Streptomyces sp. SAS_260]|uniref:TetR-like C-terminal domain-containing protein n=1 Tax=Streptomyces sp. SAS_260 TaxID=3412751 RepID=UPI00403D108F
MVREITGPDGLLLVRLAVALSNHGQKGLQARDAFRDERTRQLQSILDHARERGEQSLGALDVLDHIMAPMDIRALFGIGPLTPDYVDGLADRLLCPRPDPRASALVCGLAQAVDGGRPSVGCARSGTAIADAQVATRRHAPDASPNCRPSN